MDCCVGNKTVGRQSKMSTQLGQVPVNWKAQVFALALGQHWMPQKTYKSRWFHDGMWKIIQTHFKLIKASQKPLVFNFWPISIQISWCDQATSLGPHTARTLCHTGASSISLPWWTWIPKCMAATSGRSNRLYKLFQPDTLWSTNKKLLKITIS